MASKKGALVFCKCYQWLIRDFPDGEGGARQPIILVIFFPENCMKLKKKLDGGDTHAPSTLWIRQWLQIYCCVKILNL